MISIREFWNWKKKTGRSKSKLMKTYIISLSILFLVNPFLVLYSVEKSGVAVTTPTEGESDSSEFIREVESNSKEADSSRKKKKQTPQGLSGDQILKKKEIIEKILKYGSNRERKEAMREVVHFPREHAEELFKEISHILSTESDMGVKIFCLRTLAEVEFNKEPNSIISTLTDKNDDVKELSAAQQLFWKKFPDLPGIPKSETALSRIGEKFIHQNPWILD